MPDGHVQFHPLAVRAEVQAEYLQVHPRLTYLDLEGNVGGNPGHHDEGQAEMLVLLQRQVLRHLVYPHTVNPIH